MGTNIKRIVYNDDNNYMENYTNDILKSLRVDGKIPKCLNYLPYTDYNNPYPIFIYSNEELKSYNDIIQNYYDYIKTNISVDNIYITNINTKYNNLPILDKFSIYIELKYMPFKNIIENVILHRELKDNEVLVFKDSNINNYKLDNLLIFRSHLDAVKILNGLFVFNEFTYQYEQKYFIIPNNKTRVCHVIIKLPEISKIICIFRVKPEIKNCICCNNKFPVYLYNREQNVCSQRCYDLSQSQKSSNSKYIKLDDLFKIDDFIQDEKYSEFVNLNTISKFIIEWYNCHSSIDIMSARFSIPREYVIRKLVLFGIEHQYIFTDNDVKSFIEYCINHNIEIDFKTILKYLNIDSNRLQHILDTNKISLEHQIII